MPAAGRIAAGLIGAALALPARADAPGANAIEAVDDTRLAAGRVVVQVSLRRALLQPPPGYRVLHPDPHIVLDFPGTAIATARRNWPADIAPLRGVQLVQKGDRTRLVLRLSQAVRHEMFLRENRLLLVLEPLYASDRIEHRARFAPQASAVNRIREIEFRRGAAGEGRVVISLAHADSDVVVREQGRHVVVELHRTDFAPGAQVRLDVLDFATPVASVAAYDAGGVARVLIEPIGAFAYSALQTGTELLVAFAPPPAPQTRSAWRGR